MTPPVCLRLLKNRKRIEVRVETPLTILPFRWLSPCTISADFQAEVVERIWAQRLGLLVLPRDAINVNADYSIASLNAFHQLVPNPSSGPCVRTDEDCGYRSVFQFCVYEPLQ